MTKAERLPKLIVVGRDLPRQAGHDFNELLGYRAAATALGLEAKIILGAGSHAELAILLSASMTLRCPHPQELTSQFMVDRIVAFADASEFESYQKALDAEDPVAKDVILFSQCDPLLVRGVGQWLSSRDPERRPSVFFRFIGYELVNPKNGAYKAAAPLFRLAAAELARLPAHGRVFFLVNNRSVERAVSRACARRAFLTPLPKYIVSANPSGAMANTPSEILYVFLNSRSGRLVGQLGAILKLIRAKYPSVRVLLKFSPDLAEIYRTFQFAADERTELLPLNEPVTEYLNNLSRASVVALAYEPDAYRTLTSGVLAEAVGLGKVVVVPSGTWMAEQVTSGRASGTTFEDLESVDVAAAVLKTFDNFSKFKISAEAIAPLIRRENSCQGVVERMRNLAATEPDMRPRYRFGDEINFADALDSRCFMRGDWGYTEDWGVWTVGRRAGLKLAIEGEQQRACMLKALVIPFLRNPHNRISVDVSVAGYRVAEWTFDLGEQEGAEVRSCEAQIPSDLVAINPAELPIEFTIDKPTSPAALGLSSDLRTLGLGFRKLVLVAVADGSSSDLH